MAALGQPATPRIAAGDLAAINSTKGGDSGLVAVVCKGFSLLYRRRKEANRGRVELKPERDGEIFCDRRFDISQ